MVGEEIKNNTDTIILAEIENYIIRIEEHPFIFLSCSKIDVTKVDNNNSFLCELQRLYFATYELIHDKLSDYKTAAKKKKDANDIKVIIKIGELLEEASKINEQFLDYINPYSINDSLEKPLSLFQLQNLRKQFLRIVIKLMVHIERSSFIKNYYIVYGLDLLELSNEKLYNLCILGFQQKQEDSRSITRLSQKKEKLYENIILN